MCTEVLTFAIDLPTDANKNGSNTLSKGIIMKDARSMVISWCLWRTATFILRLRETSNIP